jgi:hypothetical protein
MVYEPYTRLGQDPDYETMNRRPYTKLPTRKVFSNPILLLLNLVHQFDKAFDKEWVMQSWDWTKEEWKDWIEEHLEHLVEVKDEDLVMKECQSSVDVLAHALFVGGHLRRRLPPTFQWAGEEKAAEDESDVFSGHSAWYSGSQHGGSGGEGSQHGGETRGKRGGGSQGGMGVARTSEKRKQGEATDCTAMVKEWRQQNSQEAGSVWSKVFELKGMVSRRGMTAGGLGLGGMIGMIVNQGLAWR